MSSVAPRRGFGFWSFIVLMVLLTALFVGLGVWQVERLAQKEALIGLVSSRATLPPTPYPGPDTAGLDPENLNYRQLTLQGHYVPEQSVLVFIGLSDPKGGRFSGPGYFVMTPFVLDAGGTLFVNRGFVPQDQAAAFRNDPSTPTGNVTITAVARAPESPSVFTPAPDTATRTDWVRDPARLAAFADPALDPFLPFTADLPATPSGALPQGGETVMEFPNNHLGYAITWFGFALITPLLLASWIWRQRHPKAPPAQLAAEQRID